MVGPDDVGAFFCFNDGWNAERSTSFFPLHQDALPMREIIYDIESTGLEIDNGDRIIEIAAVEIIDRRITGRTFHSLVNNEGRAVNPDIYEKDIHKITVDMLVGQPTFKEVIPKFLDFCRGAIAIAHNSKSFDEKFLNHEIERVRHPEQFWQAVTKTVDSLEIAKKVRPGQKNNLDKLMEHYGIDASERAVQGHNALLDSQLLAEVYLRMTEGLDLTGPSLEEDVPRAPVQYLGPDARGRVLTVRRADELELAQHEAYLDALAKDIKGEPVERKVTARSASGPRL